MTISWKPWTDGYAPCGWGYDVDYQMDIGAMTTARQLAEVRRQVDAALAAGARIHAQSETALPEKGLFLPAMVLTDVNHDMDIMRLETFGPVLGVMPVADMATAVTLANDSDLGLTASVWTTDRSEGMRLSRELQAGVVMINDHLMSHGMAETPWGGFKESGIGRSHGATGFAEMTQVQCLVDDWMPGVKQNLWWHPHSPQVYNGVRAMLDLLYGRRLLRRLNGLFGLLKVTPRMFRQNR